ncbi:MAG TPA: 2-oxoacid:acceptor oxidoreductase subunit alpha, partial [Myxococcales bacterium]|nr:2-oxoacid:acceptor oxidoreductase subunit alpha [Myxococcales bacterium]
MSEQLGAPSTTSPQEIVNDFVLNVATANGTGSQTSNIALARTFFRMGISVAPKNLFPSNIQGLPTWYRVRLNDKGYTGYSDKTHILVAMNQATVHEDVTLVEPGGVIFYNDSLRMPAEREDVTYYAMPVKEIVKQVQVPTSLRNYIANMVYVGVLCQLLDIELDEIRLALDTHFKGKQKAVDLNMEVVNLSAEWARQNIAKVDPFKVKRIEGGNEGKILAEGNMSGALGSIYGGIQVVAWYPITPATSLADGLNEYLPQLRNDEETGKATYAIFQAEDELAALGAVIGAGWSGARAMTSTAGPGISLMSEFTGLAYQAEIPAVVWDIQRMGPSTGLPTRTSQGDIISTYFLSHGDCRHVILFPSSPKECFEFGHIALDLAERLQTPVFVLSDLDLGMNLWISDPYEYPEAPIDRGKVVSVEQLNEWKFDWGRYKDVDGDGIGHRSIPGTPHKLAGYFTRGTGHNEKAEYSERAEDWQANLQRLE